MNDLLHVLRFLMVAGTMALAFQILAPGRRRTLTGRLIGLTAGILAALVLGHQEPAIWWVLTGLWILVYLPDPNAARIRKFRRALLWAIPLVSLCAFLYPWVVPAQDWPSPGDRWIMIGAGYLFILLPASRIVQWLTREWKDAIQLDGLEGAGQWIGMLERALILTFVLLGEYGAIGFLIAAKSVFRLNEKERKEAEYIIIGTLSSFALGLLTGILVRYGLTWSDGQVVL